MDFFLKAADANLLFSKCIVFFMNIYMQYLKAFSETDLPFVPIIRARIWAWARNLLMHFTSGLLTILNCILVYETVN